ncbi:hypothetical protein BC830DRAFT_1175125 [Chytriomyces sp. MP71]|nr:hypothetical protein BC830DRAFT_1175125 [Chytriomyces sp. MP71]
MLSDGSTGVWVVSTFAPANDTEFGVDLTYGLVALEIAGAKRVIVDVTNNGGGDITLGCAAAYFLSPWKSRSCYHYDIRLPNVTAQILKAAHAESKRNATFDAKIFNITGYGRDEGSFEAMMDPHELIDGARLIRRGGEYARYSAIFTLDHECKRAIDIVTNSSALPQLKRGWDVKNLVVVSNGFCGSTCSNFVRTLRDKRGIKTFTYGGPTGAPFQPTAFEGGLVVTYDELSLSLATDIPNAPHVDRLAFPIRGRIPFFEIYPDADPKGQGAPAEWVEQVSEFHVDGVQPTLPESVWEGVRRQWVGRKDKGGLFKQD